MKKILLLEDDEALGKGISLALQSREAAIDLCTCLSQARELFDRNQYDLLILDINLPDGSGLDFLREVRELSRVPAMMLTANDMEIDIVTGLESGADDYITKPFSLAVLRARVHAQLRRSERPASFISGRFYFDFEKMDFRKDGKALELSKTEQKLLRILVENRGNTVSRAALVDGIWTDGSEYVDENALSVSVKRLRSKLEDKPSAPVFLKTIYGLGYSWTVMK